MTRISSPQKFSTAAAAASVLLLTAACGGSSSTSDTTPTSSSPSSSAPSASNSSSGSFKDGKYEGKGHYANPGGDSELTVDLTLKGNKITDVAVIPGATNSISKGFQTQFASGIANEVVGQSIDSLNVSAVAGSSLTVQGFNQAIDAIKAEAKA